MHNEHEYLAAPPFDLYELHLFIAIAETKSFTKAGERTRLTQSAVTRQIAGMEQRLGIALFERTTRNVALTQAGKSLLAKARSLVQATYSAVNDFQKEFTLADPILRVGIARTIGLAYLPGFFFAFRRKFPRVRIQVTQASSTDLLEAVNAGKIDAGLVCLPPRMPSGLNMTHRFRDEFTFIVPPNFPISEQHSVFQLKAIKQVLKNERWLFINAAGHTGSRMREWFSKRAWEVEPIMELDSFDMIVNLVSLGLGVSLVPHRVLPLYQQRRHVRRILTVEKFSRELGVVVRKNRKPPAHVTGFIDNILF